MIGAIAAAAAVSATLPGPMAVNVRLGGDASVARGLFVEMFATLQLVFSVVMLAAVKHKATYLAPIGIGIATFIGHMCSEYIFLAETRAVKSLINVDNDKASTTLEQE